MAARWAPVVGLLLLLRLPPMASASSMVFKLDGNVYPDRHFYVTFNIGEPAKPYFLDVTTGSNLTWLECDVCGDSCKIRNKLSQGPHPLYRPTNENKFVPCAHSLCDALHQDLGEHKDCLAPTQCNYEIKYLDGASFLGVLVIDNLSFPTEKFPKTHPVIAFGCGYNQGRNSGNKASVVDGVLGLGRALRIKPNDYSLGRETLHLDTKQIGANPMELVLDSGSPYTYLPDSVHVQLVSSLKASLSKSLKEVPDPELTLCWKGPRPFRSVDDLKKEFKPLVSLKLEHGVTMMIPPKNYLIITESGNACLGTRGIRNLYMYLIGGISLQDQLVIYDNEKEHIGWMR
ncbi:hypothetical protein ACP4OV_014661 [Aristida adscensionis]